MLFGDQGPLHLIPEEVWPGGVHITWSEVPRLFAETAAAAAADTRPAEGGSGRHLTGCSAATATVPHPVTKEQKRSSPLRQGRGAINHEDSQPLQDDPDETITRWGMAGFSADEVGAYLHPEVFLSVFEFL